jgi:hypothetical protein
VSVSVEDVRWLSGLGDAQCRVVRRGFSYRVVLLEDVEEVCHLLTSKLRHEQLQVHVHVQVQVQVQ